MRVQARVLQTPRTVLNMRRVKPTTSRQYDIPPPVALSNQDQDAAIEISDDDDDPQQHSLSIGGIYQTACSVASAAAGFMGLNEPAKTERQTPEIPVANSEDADSGDFKSEHASPKKKRMVVCGKCNRRMQQKSLPGHVSKGSGSQSPCEKAQARGGSSGAGAAMPARQVGSLSVSVAPSGRAKCRGCSGVIPQGALRISKQVNATQTVKVPHAAHYHTVCYRYPPGFVAASTGGFRSLSATQQRDFCCHFSVASDAYDLL